MKLREYKSLPGQPKCHMGFRSADAVRWVVIHDTENPRFDSALNTAQFLMTREDGSAHEANDSNNTYVLGNWRDILCGTGGFNTATYHIEQAGRAAWSEQKWYKRYRQIKRVAFRTAWLCHRHGLPPRYRNAKALKAGRPGYTSHLQVTLSKLGSTTHTDPGKNFPFTGKRGFNALVRYYYLGFNIFGRAKLKDLR